MNAYSREKTGLPPLDGDEDLVDFYYCYLHPQTASGKERRLQLGRKFKNDIIPRLGERFGPIPGYPVTGWVDPKDIPKEEGGMA
jgi:hypothetical protein